jgi:hypothetical protein
MEGDPFEMNIAAVGNLIGSDVNKLQTEGGMEEGVEGELVDVLELDMSDEELLDLRDEWEGMDAGYSPKIKVRQKQNKVYYIGGQRSGTGDSNKIISSNYLFSSTETFIPQALSNNPEPVVFSDNTDEGKAAANDLKTMLQYHADKTALRRKLGVMVRQWGVYFIGVLKYGWDEKKSEIKIELRKPQNFVFDPDSYVDEFGNYIGTFLGERVESSAKKLIKKYPDAKEYIIEKVGEDKLGTKVVRTEWWTDEYCFSTFFDKVLEKNKNEFFKYEEGSEEESATPLVNHFDMPKMPYTFLSVFSLQESPHDITNLIEQNIPNQDRISDRDLQISKNLASGNNAIAISGQTFTAETAPQLVESFYEEGFLLVPNGDVTKGVMRIPASPLPSGILEAQENDKNTLQSIYGVQGLTTQPQNEDTTARGMILNQSHDSSRIGGGVGDALEQVANTAFNWMAQLYCVFYDIPHYAAIMGNGRAVEYVALSQQNMTRKFVISVSPNSMQPKDEVSEMNQALTLANEGWLDPINLFKKLNYPDPMNTAKMVTMFRMNPQLYFQTFFPEANPQQQQGQAPPVGGGGSTPQPASPPTTLSSGPASANLNNVPLK